MIAAWMLYAVVSAALIAVAAWAGERAALATRRPVRHVWTAAIALTVAWPFGAFAVATLRPAAAAPAVGEVAGPVVVSRIGTVVIEASEAALGGLPPDAIAVAAWGALTLLLAVRLVAGVVVLRRRRRAWRRATVDGVAVEVSPDTGPAVVGLNPMAVVIPEWTLQLEPHLRALVLAHEEEHRRARDPLLLVAAKLVAVLFPWNLALLWQVRRVRLAVELDCDARVLGIHPERDRYAKLLVAMAQRASVGAPVPGPALSEPVQNLSRRIVAMHTVRTSISRTRLIGYSAFGAMALVVACSVDTPTPPRNAKAAVASERDAHPDTLLVVADSVADAGDSTLVSVKAALTEARRRIAELEREVEAVRAREILRSGRDSLANPRQVRLVAAPEREVPVVERGAVGRTGTQPNVYFDFQVAKQAVHVAGGGRPVYPPALRDAGTEGSAVVSFVVGSDGRVEMTTFTVVRASHQQFADAVRDALPSMRFESARTADGRAVRQLVQTEFQFKVQ